MSAPPPAHPETMPCVRCRVAIHAASGYCTLCGASQRVRRPFVRWLVGGLAAALIGGAAVAGVLLLGGTAAGGADLRLYRSPEVVTLVPSGWTGGRVLAPSGITRVVFSDPTDAGRRLTVSAERPAPLNALVRAHAYLARARAAPGFRSRFFGRIRFADGRPAWLLTYDAGGATNAVYVYSACTPTYAMTVELRAPSRAAILRTFRQIPASAIPRC